MTKRPNILIIQTDQQRYDSLGCAGNPSIKTPHLDRMAAEGVYFERMYAASPLCMPSRASLFTGQNIRGHGVWTNGVPTPVQETMATRLKSVGYTTSSIGKLHLTPFGMPPYIQDGSDQFQESFEAWPQHRKHLDSGSYFGIDDVQIVLGHNRPDGHYGDWLRSTHPEALAMFGPEAATEPPTGAMQSWKSALPVELHSSTWIGDRTVDFLRGRDRAEDPFFLWVSFPDPHHPFAPPAPYSSMYDPALMPAPKRRDGELADKPDHFGQFVAGGVLHEGAFPEDVPCAVTPEHVREITAHCYGMVSLVDDNVGRILAALDNQGLAEDTLVLFLSDHGEMLGDHGLILKGPYMYESLIRTPFLLRYPALFPAGLRATGLWSQIDVLPTVMELAGLDASNLPGRSLVTTASDPGAGRDAVLVEYHSGYWPKLNLKTLITKDLKLTVYPGGREGELYDLSIDPWEFDNLFAHPESLASRSEMTERLLSELITTEPAPPTRFCHA